VLAPTTRYALPFVSQRAEESERAPLWVIRGRGRFGRQVAAGGVEQAHDVELETVERRTGDGPLFDDVPEVWDLFSAGRFEDDMAIVKEARLAPHPPRAICSIAAGVQDFAAEVDDVDGIYGIAQWSPGADERPELGPADDDFVDALADRAERANRNAAIVPMPLRGRGEPRTPPTEAPPLPAPHDQPRSGSERRRSHGRGSIPAGGTHFLKSSLALPIYAAREAPYTQRELEKAMQIPGAHIVTLHNPVTYNPAQIDKAAVIAHTLKRGQFVLCEPPRR
jgi:hypothetical protein